MIEDGWNSPNISEKESFENGSLTWVNHDTNVAIKVYFYSDYITPPFYHFDIVENGKMKHIDGLTTNSARLNNPELINKMIEYMKNNFEDFPVEDLKLVKRKIFKGF